MAIGMVAEAHLARGLGWISEQDYGDLRARLARCGLPTRVAFPLTDLAPLTALIEADKKNHGGRVRWSLISSIGRCEHDVVVDEVAVIEALGEVVDRF